MSGFRDTISNDEAGRLPVDESGKTGKIVKIKIGELKLSPNKRSRLILGAASADIKSIASESRHGVALVGTKRALYCWWNRFSRFKTGKIRTLSRFRFASSGGSVLALVGL